MHHRKNFFVTEVAQKPFNLFFINSQSIRNKYEIFESFSADKSIDVICVAEHWLTKEEVTPEIMDNFKTATSYCRSSKSGGGTLILTNPKYTVTPIAKINDLCMESYCEVSAVYVEEFNLTIICLYRTPSANHKIFLNNLEKIFNAVDTSKNLIVCGDFNVKFNLNDSESRDLIDFFGTFNLTPSVFFNTRGNNRLDNIFHNFKDDSLTTSKISGLSDHSGILFSIPLVKPVCEPHASPKTYRLFNSSNRLSFFNELESIDWDHIKLLSNGNEAFNEFFKLFMTAFESNFPLISRHFSTKNKSSQVKWFDDQIRFMREQYDVLVKDYNNCPNYETKLRRNKFRAKYRQAIRKAKIAANSSFIKASGNSSKSMWQLINKNREASKTINTGNISANEFNKHFTSIAHDILNKLPPSPTAPELLMEQPSVPCNKKFSFHSVSFNTVRDIINSLKNSSTRDAYDINVDLLKSIKNLIITPLTNIFNTCVASNCFPEVLKFAKVLPLFKNGELNDINNYRPISLLPIFSKVFEKIMATQMLDFLEENNILSNSQFGFRAGKSTTDAILEFIEGVIEGIESGELCIATFIDLSKAFDCISHDILLAKLAKYGFGPESCLLISSYLANRLQFTQINGDKSDILPINHGVPQGSILGPLLFLLYINDLPASVESDSVLYADDTTFITKAASLPDLLTNNTTNFNQAKVWFLANKLAMNTGKTQELIFTTKSHNFANPDFVKFLGVVVDPNLRWDQHVDFLSKKLRKTVFLLRNLSRKVSLDVLLNAYYGLFHSQISYSLLAWGHASAASRIFALQRRAIRIIAGLTYRDDCSKSFCDLKIMSLPAIYIYHCLLYMHRNRTKYNTFEERHQRNTRGNKNIYPTYLRLQLSRFSTNYYGIKFFNYLSEEVKILPYNKFKCTIKNLLVTNFISSTEDFFNISC